MNVLFDMETGDPDDLITLLLLLANPDVELRGITCWQGSPIQIGLIKHVLSLANLDIPVGGLNEVEPQELSPYYTNIVGKWQSENAKYTPNDVFKQVLKTYPDTKVLTGAPLTNISTFLMEHNDIVIQSMTTQGGYLGNLVPNPLDKFKNKQSIRTYNLSNDTNAFNIVNNSSNISKLTFVTKDLCHGFLYTPEIHSSINFGNNDIQQLLNKCLSHYGLNGKNKAMHDPLAILYMLYPELGESISINMNFETNEKGYNLFSSRIDSSNRFGLIKYDQEYAWNQFKKLCENHFLKKIHNNYL